MHPKYNFPYNDIGLVKLETDLDLSEGSPLGSICLPEPEEPINSLDDHFLLANGWGLEWFEEQPNGTIVVIGNTLQKVLLKVQAQEKCTKEFDPSLNNDHLCMETFGNRSTCLGDEGGSLAHYHQTKKRWFTYGIPIKVDNHKLITINPPVFMFKTEHMHQLMQNDAKLVAPEPQRQFGFTKVGIAAHLQVTFMHLFVMKISFTKYDQKLVIKVQKNLYGFALQNLHVNLSIGSTNNNLKTSETLAGDQIMNELFATRVSQKNSACLVHLLTGRHIVSVSNQNVTLSGLAPRGSLFQKDINVAVTSVAGHICEQQLWHVRCLLRFVHSLVHSMGAPKDAPTGDVHYLMGHSETITADSLKLSQSSINAIVSTVFNSSRKVMFQFVPASEASVCGNGVLEEGEQCDEGGGSSGGHEWGGDELCCDPKTSE
ncbi:Trypsin-like serine protease [Tyrophagus putrescentiae]|nr:Trypsin-like serine protease [Tyrophagus putrescentiae]